MTEPPSTTSGAGVVDRTEPVRPLAATSPRAEAEEAEAMPPAVTPARTAAPAMTLRRERAAGGRDGVASWSCRHMRDLQELGSGRAGFGIPIWYTKWGRVVNAYSRGTCGIAARLRHRGAASTHRLGRARHRRPCRRATGRRAARRLPRARARGAPGPRARRLPRGAGDPGHGRTPSRPGRRRHAL